MVSEIIEIVQEWNPWWEKKESVKGLEGRQRPEYNDLLDSISIKEITIITGIRRSGKSTLMYQMVDNIIKSGALPEQILFINLEDKKLAGTNLDEIYKAYRENLNPEKKAYIFLDEVHKMQGWESWIRKKYDLKTNDKFIISGSCSYLLKKEYSTLLTGRNLTFEVFPLSFKEYIEFQGITITSNIILEKTRHLVINKLNNYLKQGGFPEIFFKEERYKTKVLEQYFDDILYKDIIDRYNINSQKTKDLALFFATNFTGIISLRGVRGSLGLSYDVIKDYMSYFNDAFLFFTIDHFSYSFKEQKTLPPKIYCIDNGLRNAVSFKFSKDAGKLAENAVFIDLKRRNRDIYYWAGNGEVDFVVKNRDNSLTAINVSYTNDLDEREINALLEFKDNFEKAKDLVLITKDLEAKKNGVKLMPLWKWLIKSNQ